MPPLQTAIVRDRIARGYFCFLPAAEAPGSPFLQGSFADRARRCAAASKVERESAGRNLRSVLLEAQEWLRRRPYR
jgi:hypothetical protein